MWSTYVGISWQLHDNYYEAVTIQFLFLIFIHFLFLFQPDPLGYFLRLRLGNKTSSWKWQWWYQEETPPKRTRVVWWWWWWWSRNSSTSLHYSIRLTAATLVITHFCEVSKYTARARNTTNIFEYFFTSFIIRHRNVSYFSHLKKMTWKIAF